MAGNFMPLGDSGLDVLKYGSLNDRVSARPECKWIFELF
jgi:hypothetical protein